MVIRKSAFELKRHSFHPPDILLVVEFVSPGTKKTDRILKRHEYEAAGIANYWIADLDANGPQPKFQALRLVDGAYRDIDALHEGKVSVPDLGGADVSFAFTELLD